MRFRLSHTARIAFVACSLALSACGGGGGGGESAPAAAPGQAGSGSSSAPRIQGQPASAVAVGQRYSFQPIASDPNGDTLTFSASNLPSWLSLDPQTGRLTGTPSAADIAMYSSLTIVVSDGTSIARLGPFAVNVLAGGNGTASLSWMPPTSNTDGSSLVDLAGFVVLYGNSPSDLAHTLSITNPSVSNYVVEGLTPGTWYFAVRSVNSIGIRSEMSGMASKVVS